MLAMSITYFRISTQAHEPNLNDITSASYFPPQRPHTVSRRIEEVTGCRKSARSLNAEQNRRTQLARYAANLRAFVQELAHLFPRVRARHVRLHTDDYEAVRTVVEDVLQDGPNNLVIFIRGSVFERVQNIIETFQNMNLKIYICR